MFLLLNFVIIYHSFAERFSPVYLLFDPADFCRGEAFDCLQFRVVLCQQNQIEILYFLVEYPLLLQGRR